MIRKITKPVLIGPYTIGGGGRVLIQSMTNTRTSDAQATLSQIRALADAGCDIVRCTVSDNDDARALYQIKESSPIPVVADIHFDYRLAIAAAEAGADKIRINPGNIGSDDRVAAVCRVCREKKIPIRVGINSGSVEKEILNKYGAPTAEALCESAIKAARLLERFDFYDIVISAKSSDVVTTIMTNRLLSAQTDYPIHIGVTESGTERAGVIRSSAGIGSLLCDGIGDTIRISLSADPVKEIEAARILMAACGLRGAETVEIIACPTCGRTRVPVMEIAAELEKRIAAAKLKPKRRIRVAVMGCAVNGPGEAREADAGIAGGDGEALLFRKGKIIEKISCRDGSQSASNRLMEEIRRIIEEDNG